MLGNGATHKQIVETFAELGISYKNIARHEKHASDPAIEEQVSAWHVRKELDRTKILDLVALDLVGSMRLRLASIVERTLDYVDAALDDALEGDRDISDFNATVPCIERLFNTFDSVSGIKSLISLDTAAEALTRAGYQVVDPSNREKPVESKPGLTMEKFLEYQAKLKNNEKN